MFDAVELEALARGNPVVITGTPAEAEVSVLTVAAQSITAGRMAFLVRHTSGFVTVALPAARCDRLDLPSVAASPLAALVPSAAVSVDAAAGVSTGISALDRSHTARLLAEPDCSVGDFTRPGHLVPVRVPDWTRPGSRSVAAAALALCVRAEVEPAAVCAVLVEDSGEVMHPDRARAFAAGHALPALDVEAVLGPEPDRHASCSAARAAVGQGVHRAEVDVPHLGEAVPGEQLVVGGARQ